MTHVWRRGASGVVTGIDWEEWIGSDRAVDPYLVWADLCGPHGFAAVGDGASEKWPFIVELDGVKVVRQFGDIQSAEVPCVLACVDIDPLHVEQVEQGGQRHWRTRGRYITVRASPSTVSMLLRSPELVRFQLGVPRMPPAAPGFTPTPVRAVGGGQLERVVIGIIDDGCSFAHPSFLDDRALSRVRYLWDQDHRRQPVAPWTSVAALAGYGAQLGPKVLRGQPFAGHHRDAWSAYGHADYGAFKTDPQLHSTRPLAADGRRLPMESHVLGSHGTGVMQLAVGYPSPLRAQRKPLAAELDARPRRIADPAQHWNQVAEQLLRLDCPDDRAAALDMADQWPIVFAQLPTRTVLDTSGGSLAVHVLDAVRYVVQAAKRIPYTAGGVELESDDSSGYPDNHVIVNLSYGATAGSHDGTSILECALGEITQSNQRVWIVVAAGNAHRTRQHARVTLVRGGRRSVHFHVGPDNPQEAYLEVWLPGTNIHGQPIGSQLQRELRLDVVSPEGDVARSVGLGQCSRLGGVGPAPRAAVVYCRRVAQSASGAMILLAVSPTRPGTGRDGNVAREAGPHGMWRIDLAWGEEGATPGPPVHIDAWCERNDLVYGVPRGPQARVWADFEHDGLSEHDPEVLAYRATDGRGSTAHRTAFGLGLPMSLSSVAGGAPSPHGTDDLGQPELDLGRGRVLVVGSRRWADGEISTYSGGGPGRDLSDTDFWAALGAQAPGPMRTQPDFDAPADISPALPGVRTTGLLAGTQVRLSGTSVAVPTAVRALANVVYWSTVDVNNDKAEPRVERAEVVRSVLVDLAAAHGSPSARAQRATLTPDIDDAFRRGSSRLR